MFLKGFRTAKGLLDREGEIAYRLKLIWVLSFAVCKIRFLAVKKKHQSGPVISRTFETKETELVGGKRC